MHHIRGEAAGRMAKRLSRLESYCNTTMKIGTAHTHREREHTHTRTHTHTHAHTHTNV